jgi:hypothetical protein
MALSVTEFIEKFKELLESSDSLDDLKDKYTKWSGSIDLVGIAAGNAATKVTALGKAFSLTGKEGEEAAKKIKSLMGRVEQSMKAAGYSAEGLTSAMIALSPAAIRGLKPFETFSKVSRDAQGVTAQMQDLTNSLNKAGALKGPLRYAADLLIVGDAAKNMENQLIMTMSAAGNMDEFLSKMGPNYEQLGRKTLQFSNLTADIGSAVGLTADQVSKLAVEYMKLPGVFDATVTAGKDAGTEFHMLDAAIRVARGTGQEFIDVQRDITVMTQEFGATVQESLETISRMHSATQTLGLNMKDMKKYVRDSGEQFKFFGDNSSSALDIMGKFAPALQKSGLGPAAITQIVGGFTRGVAKMSVAQRAFLASQSGIGGGGLRGGLQIEKMLEEGKAGEVAEQVQNALKKLGGGRLLTRDQAIEGGPGAASQFEFQRQLLQSGPFGKLAGSDAEAAKLLEALSAGDRGVLEQKLTAGPDALDQTMKTGTALSKRQNNILIKANNELSKIANWQSNIAADAARTAVGVEGMLAGPNFAGDLENKARGLAKTKMIEGGAPAPNSAEFAQNLVESVTSEIGVLSGLLRAGLSKAGIDIPKKREAIPLPPGQAPTQPTPPDVPTPVTQPDIPLPPQPGAAGPTVPVAPVAVVTPPVNQQGAPSAPGAPQPVPMPAGQDKPVPAGPPQTITINLKNEKEIMGIVTLELNKYHTQYHNRIVTGGGG